MQATRHLLRKVVRVAAVRGMATAHSMATESEHQPPPAHLAKVIRVVVVTMVHRVMQVVAVVEQVNQVSHTTLPTIRREITTRQTQRGT